MILVDTCVLIDVSADDPAWRDWSIGQLAAWSMRGPLVTNPVIFAEWCTDFASLEAALATMDGFGLQWAELPHSALYLAAQRLGDRGAGLTSLPLRPNLSRYVDART